MALTVGALKSMLDDYGDHLAVVFVADYGDTSERTYEVDEVADGMFDGETVIKLAGDRAELDGSHGWLTWMTSPACPASATAPALAGPWTPWRRSPR